MRLEILSDPEDRVSPAFKVPPRLAKRVEFWFNIYTKYTATQHVIHHVDYPWVIFDVVDVKPILEGKGHKWTKHHKAEAEIRNRRKQVVLNLQKLARHNGKKPLNDELRRLAEILTQIPGKTSKVARVAASNIRSQLGQKDYIANGLINSARYMPLMEEIFGKHDLPLDLTRLPLVESSFNEHAVSKVGASGIWQIMPAMGRHFLTMHGPLDERNSPLKATEAAARILKQNLKILKSWPLAITAYNHGPGGLRKAAKKLKTEDLATMIEKYDHDNFGFATSNFYCEFLAALHAERYKDEIFGALPIPEPLQIATIALPRNFKLRTLLSMTGIPLDELQNFNPELKDDDVRNQTLIPRGYKLFVPAKYAQALENLRTGRQSQKQSKKPITTSSKIPSPQI
ncbi:MAG TPA: transglycosylase SLT domain-containing protein [Bdellovibrionales bacterium]|nr:transglycosylase SLT domain-containing protein [Bdellovibrionales bacterium]